MLLFYLYYSRLPLSSFFFFFNDTATTEIYTLSLHDALPICTRDDAPAFILTAYGKPRTDKAFTNWFREAAHKAGLPSNSSPHGMRKAACRRLAEAGCTPHQIQAITGHQNLKEIETYTKAVEQKMLAKAAMASVTKAFHHPEVANSDDGLADIDFNALIPNDPNMQVALPRGLEPLFSP